MREKNGPTNGRNLKIHTTSIRPLAKLVVFSFLTRSKFVVIFFWGGKPTYTQRVYGLKHAQSGRCKSGSY